MFSVNAALAEPKYGKDADPLWKKTHSQYFKNNEAPDFWALVGYYLPQVNGRACSATSFTMVANALRRANPYTREDAILTVESFARKYGTEDYIEALFGKIPPIASGAFANKNLEKIFQSAVEKLGIAKLGAEGAKFIQLDAQKEKVDWAKQFHEALVANEKSADDFIIINFLQGRLTGDPEGGAHVAVIAAYDAKKKSVLVFDPDREYYEPYWSPEEAVLDAIADPKADSKGQVGWFHIKSIK